MMRIFPVALRRFILMMSMVLLRGVALMAGMFAIISDSSR